jgi:hypothetical protein
METVEWRTNCWKALLLILLSLGFVGAGVAYILLVRSDPLGSICMGGCTLFFAFCAVGLLWMLIDRRPRIVLDQYGIFDRKIGVGRIAWSDIIHAYIVTLSARIGGQEFICLEVRNEEEYLQKAWAIKRFQAAGNRWLGFPPLVVNVTGTDADAHNVLALIWEFKRRSLESAEGRN